LKIVFIANIRHSNQNILYVKLNILRHICGVNFTRAIESFNCYKNNYIKIVRFISRRQAMEKVPTLKRHGSNWKNNVEADLSLLLDKKGALGAIITSRSGDVVTQLFLKSIPRQNENALMQLMKKAVQSINTMRGSTIRRVVFESDEGAVILYNAENAIVGCFLEKDYDLLSIMLEIKTVGDLIGSHLNAGELSKEEFEKIVTRDPGELKVLAFDLVGNITDHYGDAIADEFIRFTLEKNQPRWAAR